MDVNSSFSLATDVEKDGGGLNKYEPSEQLRIIGISGCCCF